VFKGNVFADNLSIAANDRLPESYPSGNYFVGSYQRIGFSDFAHGNWRLAGNSHTRNRGSDGKDPGVDTDAMIAAGINLARSGGRFEGR
jgi:hypothetical protein